MMRNHLLIAVILAAALAACGSDAGSGSDAGGGADAATADAAAGADAGVAHLSSDDQLAIAGVWESSFGGNETVSDSVWVSTYATAKVVEFDNAARWVITQNAADAKYDPNKFNKLVWTTPTSSEAAGFVATSIHVCTVDFGLDTADLAKATTKTADDGDLDKGGCGGFAWTRLTGPETAGTWQTNFGAVERIDGQAWATAWLRAFDNGKNVAYTQNAADAEFGPDQFNKVVWTDVKDGAWYTCTVDFGLDSLDAAMKSTKTADDSDPAKGGCGGFAWTKMSAAK